MILGQGKTISEAKQDFFIPLILLFYLRSRDNLQNHCPVARILLLSFNKVVSPQCIEPLQQVDIPSQAFFAATKREYQWLKQEATERLNKRYADVSLFLQQHSGYADKRKS